MNNLAVEHRKALEEFLMDIEILEKLETHISQFNVFETLGIVHTEIRHSNVLSWLLTPTENHGLGDYVVRKMIQTVSYHHYDENRSDSCDPLKISLIDYYDFEVRREWKNIDILLVSNDNKIVVAIENKVWSGESGNQLNYLKRFFILSFVVSLMIFGCSNPDTEEKKEFYISHMQSSIGAIDGDTETIDKQKFTYEITLHNSGKEKVFAESVEVVFTDWLKKQQLEHKITEIAADSESIVVKGYVIFDAAGLRKNEIVKNRPFIEGVELTTKKGKKIFVKAEQHG